jgi:hypothetical protein
MQGKNHDWMCILPTRPAETDYPIPQSKPCPARLVTLGVDDWGDQTAAEMAGVARGSFETLALDPGRCVI